MESFFRRQLDTETKTAVEDVSSDNEAAGSSGYGHVSGYGHGGGYPTFVYKEEEVCDTGLNPFLVLGTLALVAGAAALLFIRVTGGGRRKRELGEDDEEGDDLVSRLKWAGEHVTNIVWAGM